jgi:hypothetical protein
MQIYRLVNILGVITCEFLGTIRDYFLLAAAGLAMPGAVTG